ncbi:hypothetical protein [Aquibacillus kalidii]|uniref:hypothetical protein n=1 Tax=Aquibacillus kalidii TaxID=2762597 RepID=UPI001648C272|nr:hypothetical protein [Aquibacillus kalidii]
MQFGQRLFYKTELYDYLNNMKEKIKNNIKTETEDYILQVNQNEYINHLVEKFTIELLELYTDKADVERTEENIPSEYFPNRYSVYIGEYYPRPVYYYHIPFDGDRNLLNMQPSRSTLTFPYLKVEQGELVYKYVQFDDGVEELNGEITSVNQKINDMFKNVNDDVSKYNESLENFITNFFNSRKQEILNQRKQEEAIIVPIRRKEKVSKTFTVPSPDVKKRIRLKPSVDSGNYIPDPTLHEEVYTDILRIINDMGKEFERKPSVYSNKGEEDLRDHFLMLLEPHFYGSATGETFNKKGKTDILLRYEGKNLFIGECKFWRGEKSFLKTIDQLLGYLTWRDSKAAVIMFVDNHDFSSVLEKAKESIKTHRNYIKEDKIHDDTWINYKFHINGDTNKELHLALMMYHTV